MEAVVKSHENKDMLSRLESDILKKKVWFFD